MALTRPLLWQALLDADHPSTLIVPLTTNLVDDAEPLRLRIHARERLAHDSDLLIDQLRVIDNLRLSTGPLARLSATDMRTVYRAIVEVLEIPAE